MSDQGAAFVARMARAHRTPTTGSSALPDLARLPRGPQDPGWQERIPPPEPLPPDPPALRLSSDTTLSAAPSPAPAGAVRIVVSYGRYDKYNVGLERAPDWDVAEGEVWTLSAATLREALPLLRKLTRVKDLTGELKHDELPDPDPLGVPDGDSGLPLERGAEPVGE